MVQIEGSVASAIEDEDDDEGRGRLTPDERSSSLPHPMYVELHARSAFSFLRGASSPEQLIEVAGKTGLPALALCDRNGVHGAPRAFGAAKENGLRSLVGSELILDRAFVHMFGGEVNMTERANMRNNG